jgi:hypothetical protein
VTTYRPWLPMIVASENRGESITARIARQRGRRLRRDCHASTVLMTDYTASSKTISFELSTSAPSGQSHAVMSQKRQFA